MDGTDYPEAIEINSDRTLGNIIWDEGGLRLILVQFFMRGYDQYPHYNGYVRFPLAPLDPANRVHDYIAARGGITFAEIGRDGTGVYGFDTYHLGDERDPDVSDAAKMGNEIRKMARLIALAVPFEFAIKQEGGIPDRGRPSQAIDQILAAYGEQVTILREREDFSADLPDDFWDCTKQHPLFRQ